MGKQVYKKPERVWREKKISGKTSRARIGIFYAIFFEY